MRASARELLVPFFTPLVWCGCGIRTHDLPLRKRTLYQLSYMQGNTLNLHIILTPEVGFKGQILKLCRCKYIFIELSTKTYLTGVCYDLNDTVGELRVR